MPGNIQNGVVSEDGKILGNRSSRMEGPAMVFSCTMEMYWSMEFSRVLPLMITSVPMVRA